MSDKWPYPTGENTLVGDSEAFVRVARQRFADDVKRLTQEVTGPAGRGFMQVVLTPEEREEQYRMARQAGTPDPWLQQLVQAGNSPEARRRLFKAWRESEAKYREANGG